MAEYITKKINSGIAVIGPASAVDAYPQDDLTFAAFDSDRLEVLSGTVGGFELLLRGPDGLRTIHCGAIVLVPAVSRGESEGQKLFSRLCTTDPRRFSRQRTAVVLDRMYPADADLWQPLLEAAPRITAAGGRVDIICRQTAVDFTGGQAAYTEARSAGVRFIRYADDLECTEHTVNLNHAIVNSPELEGEVTLEYDLIAEPARKSMPAALREWMLKLGIFTDAEGLPLRGNLRLEPPASNIRGIFIADQAASQDALEEARALTASGTMEYIPEAVEIDGRLCAACLTCVRICPLNAPEIRYDEELQLNRAFINYEACGGCGICAGECPADAITINKNKDVSP